VRTVNPTQSGKLGDIEKESPLQKSEKAVIGKTKMKYSGAVGFHIKNMAKGEKVDCEQDIRKWRGKKKTSSTKRLDHTPSRGLEKRYS